MQKDAASRPVVQRPRASDLAIPQAELGEHNPNYLQGEAIPVLMRMDARNFASLVQTSFGAWRRR